MAEISVRPRVRYPRDARVGVTYVMTVDLDHEVPPNAWPYAEEEYPVTCFLDAGSLFDHEPIGDRTIVVHRFGGSYGPAVFRLHARQAGSGTMRLTLADRAGLPVAVISLDGIEIREASSPAVELAEPIADLGEHLRSGSRGDAKPRPVDALIFVTLEEELAGVLAEGGGPDMWRALGERTFVRTFANRAGQPINIAVVCLGVMGATAMATRVTELIDRLQPSRLATCGICVGNRSDVARGDVIFADRVYRFDHATLFAPQDRALLFEDIRLEVESQWQVHLPEVVRDRDWVTYFLPPNGAPADAPLQVHVGTLATCDEPIGDPEIFDRVRHISHQTLGLEMASSAIAVIADAVASRHTIVIRGISDYIDSDKDDRFRELACHASAACLLSFLMRYLAPQVTSSSPDLGDIGERHQTMPAAERARGFRWLHLSDLQCGEKRRGSHAYLVSLMLHDLGQLIRRDGAIDALFVTGDLSFTGTSQETSEAAAILAAVQRGIGGVQGSSPVLFSVPGNHDFDMRITPGYKQWARRWHRDSELRASFFSVKSRFRNLVIEGFDEYTKWFSKGMPRDEPAMRFGLIPGDFSCSFERAGVRVGVIGLNDSFLHPFGGEHVGLELCLEQLEAVCKHIDSWTAAHDIRILLTHHDPALLHERARIQFDTQIAPPGRFQLHLHGGLHEGGPQFIRESKLRRGASLRCQARAFAEPSRSVVGGYTVGEIQPMGPEYHVRIWPRMCMPRVVPDRTVRLNEQGSAHLVLARPELFSESEAPSWYVERAVDRRAFERLAMGKWIYVHGPRRSGRTSLLQHLARELNVYREINVEYVAATDFEERSAMKLHERIRAARGAVFVDDIDQIVDEPRLRAVLADLRSLQNQKIVCLAGLRSIQSSPVAIATIPIEDFTSFEMNGFRDRIARSPAERLVMLDQVHALTGGEASTTRFLVDALRTHPGEPSMSAGELIEQAIEQAFAAGEAPERIDLRDAAALRIYARILRTGKAPSSEPVSPAERMLLDSGLVCMTPGTKPALRPRSQLHLRLYDQAWVDARLMELEAPDQTFAQARKSEPGETLVLLLDLAENPIDEATVFAQLPEGVTQPIVLRLTDFGVARYGTGTSDDWLPVLSAIDRMLEAARAQERRGPCQYWISGRAGLPAFFYLGHRLGKFTPVTLVHSRGISIVDVLPLDLLSPPVEVSRPYFTRSPRPTRPQRSQTWLGLVVSSVIRIRREQIEELMIGRGMAPAAITEAQAIDPLDERNVMAASIELEECMAGLSAWYPQHEGLAVFIAGPTTLAFLVGRAIHSLVFPRVQVFQYRGESYTLAYDTGLLRPDSASTPVSAKPEKSASSQWGSSWELGSEDISDEILDVIRDDLIQAVHEGDYPVGYTEIEDLLFRNIDKKTGVAEFRASFSAEHHREDFEFDGHVEGYIEFEPEVEDKQVFLDSVKVSQVEAHFDMGEIDDME